MHPHHTFPARRGGARRSVERRRTGGSDRRDRTPDRPDRGCAPGRERRRVRRPTGDPGPASLVHPVRRRHRHRPGRGPADLAGAGDLAAPAQAPERAAGAGAAARRPACGSARSGSDLLRQHGNGWHLGRADHDGPPERRRQEDRAQRLRARHDGGKQSNAAGTRRRPAVRWRASSPNCPRASQGHPTSRAGSRSTSHRPAGRHSPGPRRSCGRSRVTWRRRGGHPAPDRATAASPCEATTRDGCWLACAPRTTSRAGSRVASRRPPTPWSSGRCSPTSGAAPRSHKRFLRTDQRGTA